MNKMKLLLALSFVAGIASADIAVKFDNLGGTITTDGSTFVDQALAQLIWSPNAPIAQAGVGGALGTGEYMLRSFVTTSTYAGTWSDRGERILNYSNADVGGLVIENGYFFVRLFDNAALAGGDHYLQQSPEGTPLETYDVMLLNEYNTNIGTSGADTQNGITGGDLSSSPYAIPEPTVMALIGVFGGGLMVVRRFFSMG